MLPATSSTSMLPTEPPSGPPTESSAESSRAGQSAKGSLPRYVQIESSLRTLLETGGYRPGDKLPPEPELAQQLSVSRATLREALRSFEQQGIIRRKQGAGTFLNPQPAYIERGLEVLESIEMLLSNRGLSFTSIERSARAELALPKAASRLNLSEGTPLTSLRSTYAINQKPVAYLMEVIPAVRLSVEEVDERTSSLLDMLLAGTGGQPPPAYAVSHIAPVLGTPEIVTALGISDQTPLFFIEQTLFNHQNAPCYYARNYYVPQTFDFHIVRKLSPSPG